MCGILAYFGQKQTKENLLTALHLQDHRGPDASGVFQEKGCFLGHKRLSIIDLNERSNQPFKKRNYVLVFNGEIYNYKELIREHQLTVETTSDTEVVLEMFERYGEKCLSYFNGMFAFVLLDTVSGKVFAARDRLGIKPLYYLSNGSELIFSSEIASVLQLSSAEFDEFGLRQYRKLRMTVNGYTVYKDIKMFPAGSYYANGSIHKYWELEINEKPAPSDEELKALIEDAVRLRMRSDVSVGTYLSGGLDSTIVTYLAKPSNTYTVGFDELNEFEYARIADKGLDSKHHEVLIDTSEFIDIAKEMVEKRKEPLSVPNEVLIYLMTKKVKELDTVVLSGEGADELFWGYDRIFRWAHKAGKSFALKAFDQHYCYGTHEDDEVLDFALEGTPDTSVLDKVGYYFQINHLQGLLRRVDNSTMLCSVEARVPFVDHRLVEMMAGVPFEWRMGASFKEPLKRIFSDLIPEETIHRKKVGFPVPLSSIFDVSGKTAMDDWLAFNVNLLTK